MDRSIYVLLVSYTPAIDEYEFRVRYTDQRDPVATVFVTHRNDQTDITVELIPSDDIVNCPSERVEFMLHHGAAIFKSIKNAMED